MKTTKALTVSKELLTQKYVYECKPMKIVASELGISVGSVHKYIHKYGINARGKHDYSCTDKQIDHIRRLGQSRKGKPVLPETRAKISKSKAGKFIVHSKYGGHRKHRTDGYIAVYAPDHPSSNMEGYVMEHRLVMEEDIGRHLKDGEVVHHINCKRNDNRVENLMLMTPSEHMRHHMSERHKIRKGK